MSTFVGFDQTFIALDARQPQRESLLQCRWYQCRDDCLMEMNDPTLNNTTGQ